MTIPVENARYEFIELIADWRTLTNGHCLQLQIAVKESDLFRACNGNSYSFVH